MDFEALQKPGDPAILVCSINTASTMDTYTLNLQKDDITLMMSQGTSLVFNTSATENPYGLYVCTVEGSINNVSLLLEENGKAH